MLPSWFALNPGRPSLAKTKNVPTWLTCFAFVFISGCSGLRQVNILVNFGHDLCFFLWMFQRQPPTTTPAASQTFPRCRRLFFGLECWNWEFSLWVERWNTGGDSGCKINAECRPCKTMKILPSPPLLLCRTDQGNIYCRGPAFLRAMWLHRQGPLGNK